MTFVIPTRGPASLQSTLGLLLSFALPCKGPCCLSECPRASARLCQARMRPSFPVEHHRAFVGLCWCPGRSLLPSRVWQLLLGFAGAHQCMGRGGPPTALSAGHFLMRAVPGVSLAAGSWLGQGVGEKEPSNWSQQESFQWFKRSVGWDPTENCHDFELTIVLTTACHLQPCRYCTLAAAGIHQVLFLRLSWNNCFCSHPEHPTAFLEPFCGSYASYPKPLTVQAHLWIDVLQ